MLEKESKEESKKESEKPEPGCPVLPNYQPVDPPMELTVSDLVYGILFEPVKTYQKVVAKPPLWTVFFLVTGLSILLAVMSVFTPADLLTEELAKEAMVPAEIQMFIEAIAPFWAVSEVVFGILFWFVAAALLHLVAEFYGGQGRAKASFAVCGLAGLPAVFLLPIQGLEIVFPNAAIIGFLSGVATLAVFAWGVILLIVGFQETHKFSAGRSLVVIITPWVVVVFLTIIMIIMFVGVVAALAPHFLPPI